MGRRALAGRRAPGKGHHRTRYRAAPARHQRETHPLLWWRIPFRTERRKSAKNGLYQRGINGRRMERLAGSGPSDAEGLKLTSRASPKKGSFTTRELAGAEGFEPSPSSLTVRCPTGWTTPQRRLSAAREEPEPLLSAAEAAKD